MTRRHHAAWPARAQRWTGEPPAAAADTAEIGDGLMRVAAERAGGLC